jgi:hypothetical protein
MAKTIGTIRQAMKRRIPQASACLALLLGASCVPGGYTPRLAAPAFEIELPPAQPLALAAAVSALPVDDDPVGAFAANAALALAKAPNPAPRSVVLRASSAIDQMRSLDCLAEAVYYEARSEGEDGQRAVAQVVLNRVRHPAWPNSVCGVVYQGPMRAGGGCQFTFTCDGSLAQRATGPAWERARRIAGEALAGRTFAGVGHSTHYHTHAVFPHWAPRLWKTAVIGSHNFYRLPAGDGMPGAFVQAYAGREPEPRPAVAMAAASPSTAPLLSVSIPAPRSEAEVRAAVTWPAAAEAPQAQIREAYRNSGRWRDDAPVRPAG